jgi:hypothetical protein
VSVIASLFWLSAVSDQLSTKSKNLGVLGVLAVRYCIRFWEKREGRGAANYRTIREERVTSKNPM